LLLNLKVQRIAVVGAGPAGLAFSTAAAKRGHLVTLFDQESEIGGQFNMAKLVPGKEEFYETLRYFKKQLELNKVLFSLYYINDSSISTLPFLKQLFRCRCSSERQ